MVVKGSQSTCEEKSVSKITMSNAHIRFTISILMHMNQDVMLANATHHFLEAKQSIVAPFLHNHSWLVSHC